MQYKTMITTLLLICSIQSVFAYNFTFINKTKSDIEIEYVICTNNSHAKTDVEAITCAPEIIKFTVPAKNYIKNPFTENVLQNPDSSPYVSLVGITSLSGDFEKIRFLTHREWAEACGIMGNDSFKECWNKYGPHSVYPIVSKSYANSAEAIIISDENMGFPHIERIYKPGLPTE